MPNTKLIWLAACLAFQSVQSQTSINSADIDSKHYDPTTLLWYAQPASKWEEAMPVGNGRLGAMVFGKTTEERIQLNEDTYWTGGPYSTVVKGGSKMLPEIQKDVFDGKLMQAHNLFGRSLMGYPVEQQKYQCLANLMLSFKGEAQTEGYKRWLNLETGTCTVQYTAGGVNYRREIFASRPDQVIVIRLSANKKNSISLEATLRGVRNQTHSNYATDYFRMDGLGNDGILDDLFDDFEKAAQTLHVDNELGRQAGSARSRLRPPLVGKDSLLQEWTEDWGQLEKQHRHLSPLYGLYPGNVFSVLKTPALIPAILQTLQERGDEGPGFSIAWKMCLWARLANGNRAEKLFKTYLKTQCFPSLFAKGGTQFQVDGVFGVAAGVTEMLLQSQDGIINLLPALPDEWGTGELTGMRVRGGFELSMKWKDRKITYLDILSRAGQPCRIYTPGQTRILCDGHAVRSKSEENHVVLFPTSAGKVYTIKMQ